MSNSDPIDGALTPAERQRILDCVDACEMIGKPAAIVCLLAALSELIDAWNAGDRIGVNDAEAQMTMDAVAKLELQPPPDESQN